MREDFLPSEIDAIRRKMEPAEAEAATIRKLSGRSSVNPGQTRDKIGKFAGISGRTVEKADAKDRQGSRTDKHGALFAQSEPGKTRDKIGKLIGISGRTIEKIAAVCDEAYGRRREGVLTLHPFQDPRQDWRGRHDRRELSML